MLKSNQERLSPRASLLQHSYMDEAAVDKAALDKLQQEIETRVEEGCHQFQVQFEAMFKKLQKDVQVAFRGIECMAVVQSPQQPARNHKHPKNGMYYNVMDGEPVDHRIPEQQQSKQPGGLTFCCSALSAGSVQVVGQQEMHENQMVQTKKHQNQDVNWSSSPKAAITVKPKTTQGAVAASTRMITASTIAKPWVKDTDPGQPKGEFQGRTNMFAFLQSKCWDSDTAQEPSQVIEDESETDTGSIRHPAWIKIKEAINSTTFDLIVGVVILLNSIVMGLQLEYEGVASADAIGLESEEGPWYNAEEAFRVFQHLFAILFLVEFILRVSVMHLSFFKTFLNWMDFLIVVASVIELWIIPAVGVTAPDMSIMRLLRVLRILRILRMVRLMKMLPKLRLLVIAVSHSIWSLVWSMVLLSLVKTIAAIFMTMAMQSYLQDETRDAAQREQVYTYFGTFSRSLISMFEITLSIGTWGRCGRIVIYSVNRWYAVFFLGYMTLISFAMMRVIAAIFLKDTLSSAAKDDVKAMVDENRDPQYVKRAWILFQEMDEDNEGEIPLPRLSQCVQDPRIAASLKQLGVVPHEVPGLFTLMDDGDDSISFCEFLTGIMRLKNAKQGVDLATLLYENKKLLKRVLKVGSQVEGLKADLIKVRAKNMFLANENQCLNLEKMDMCCKQTAVGECWDCSESPIRPVDHQGPSEMMLRACSEQDTPAMMQPRANQSGAEQRLVQRKHKVDDVEIGDTRFVGETLIAEQDPPAANRHNCTASACVVM